MPRHAWFTFTISHHSAKFCGHKPWRRRRIFLSLDLMWPHGRGVLWHHDWMASSPHNKSLSYQVCWSQVLRKRTYFVFSLSRDLTWLCGQRVTEHYEWVFFIISDYPAKIGDHRSCGREDIKLSFCHVTSRDDVVRSSCDIIGEFPQHKSLLCQVW